MRLESALYTSRSGLETHGQAISVLSNNIANAETLGFKSSRARFGDLVTDYQGSRDSSSLDVGSGADMIAIQRDNGDGAVDFTGRQLDFAITGKGYFVVGDSDNPLYTRAGNFRLDADGNLVTLDGKSVLGTPASTTTEEADSAAKLSKINLIDLGVSAKATSIASLSGNLSSTSAITTVPDNPETFKDLGKAASAVNNFIVYDSLGAAHNVYLGFFKTESNKWKAVSYVDGKDTSGGTEGKPVKIGEVDLEFTSSGIIEEANQEGAKIDASATYANGAAAGAFSINLGTLTQTANASQPSGIAQDGLASGDVRAYEVRSNGDIYATLSSGSTIKVATLNLANVVNDDGLKAIGGNYFMATDKTGKITNGIAEAEGLGTIQGGALERSAVDLQTEFVDMVTIQRGYQASSQVLNNVNDLYRRTIELAR